MKTTMQERLAQPLLDAAASALRARPLRSWPSAARESLRGYLLALHRTWATEWLPGLEGTMHAPEIALSEAGDGAQDQVLWSFAPPQHEASVQGGIRAAIGAAMFGTGNAAASSVGTVHPRMADQIALEAWNDWLHRLGQALDGFNLEQQHAPPMSHVWSGGLQASWSWCGGIWTLVLPYDAVATITGPSAVAPTAPQVSLKPIEALDAALGNGHITLRVLLEGTELNLGQLQDLRIGDVVPLAHRLDSPAQVIVRDGAPVCEGWLGQRNNCIAIELAHPRPLAVHPTSSPKEEQQ